MMRLSKQNLNQIRDTAAVAVPTEKVFSLPEKVLQFGTGVFIRGLIDYLIDKANNENIFNGRVVMVKSTNTGDTTAYKEQDGLYTLLIKSKDGGGEVDEAVICAAISRVLHASEEWHQILACASNTDLKIIISNTTETGIALVETDKVDANPPVSFPGKLLSFLLERYKSFGGTEGSGMVIVPTELIPDNASKLNKIVNELAVKNNLDKVFIEWLNNANDFCNSLVDRIVPGKLPAEEHHTVEKKLGYHDDLMIMSEPFALWAIETSSERTKEILSFNKVHSGIHIVPNINKFRELKLRLLNGSHNLSCALGYIAGFNTVKEAMANKEFDQYMIRLILDEIAAAIIGDNITAEDAKEFGTKVLDRYRNPYIEFEWLSICVQDTSKIKIRAVPIVQQHFEKFGFVPDGISLGFAAYILFMKSEKNAKGEYVGNINGREYTINDDFAENLYQKWKTSSEQDLVVKILKDETLWDADLSSLNGFADSVYFYLQNLSTKGFFKTFELTYESGQH